MMENIRKLLPALNDQQIDQIRQFCLHFREINRQINLVSRKDIENFEAHHLLHALSIAHFIQLPRGTRVLDVGTGGGLPGLPLAICFPEVQFHLLDSVGKKIHAVQEMSDALKLKNVETLNRRAEGLKSRYHYITGRAVAALPTFLSWIYQNLHEGGPQNTPCGVIYQKGTLYREELNSIGLRPCNVHDIHKFLNDEYYRDKFIIHLRSRDIIRNFRARKKRGGQNGRDSRRHHS